ncbi:MAG TPA: hypothetical protein P5120_19330 [Spirochaetota bacterium]|nr:hypothetical protein [Spirochaetota bacterium]HPR39364.1 hypothetical protein [Spirochaetota bacterium]HRX49685.1 hypothetical protein [Spirochaetota bacterium]
MKSDKEIRHEGFKALFSNMDIVEAERFIALINREKFDYTEWRKNLFQDMTAEEIIREGRKFAVDFRKIKGEI